MLVCDAPDAQGFFYKGTSSYLLVAFAPMTMRANGKTFWAEPIARKAGISTIGIVAKNKNWYPSDSVRRIFESLKGVVDNHQDVLTYGSSMGGYGALKYASLFHAKVSLAFAPQHSIDPSELDKQDGRYTGYYRDAVHRGHRVEPSDLGRSSYIFFDPCLKYDAYNARVLASLNESVILMPAPYVGHDVVRLMAGTAQSTTLFEKAIALDTPAIRYMLSARRRASSVRTRFVLERMLKRNPAKTVSSLAKYYEKLEMKDQVIFLKHAGMFYASTGDLGHARRLYIDALKLSPNDLGVLQRLSDLAARLGDDEIASALSEKATRFHINHPEAHSHYAACLIRLGRLDEAREELTLALAIAPNHPGANRRLAEIDKIARGLETSNLSGVK